MSQKNRRNTRRGRAKRWCFVDFWCGRPIYALRGTSVEVWRGIYSDMWIAGDGAVPFQPVAYPSRAAAMRAAEHMARGARAKGGAP